MRVARLVHGRGRSTFAKGSAIVVVANRVWVLEIGPLATNGDLGNQSSHGHLDVEFDDVDERVELDVDDTVFEGHKAD